MKISELLKLSIEKKELAFLVGSIYGWPILKDNQIIAKFEYKPKNGIKSKTLFLEDDINNLGKTWLTIINKKFSNYNIYIDNTGGQYNYSKIQFCFENDVTVITNFEDESNVLKFLGILESYILDYSDDSKKYFISGLMNSRGSIDLTANFMAIDLIGKFPKACKKSILTLQNVTGVYFNYNPRIMQENSSQKNPQYRIPLDYYMHNFGLLIPFKKEYYNRQKKANLSLLDDFYFDKTNNIKIKPFKGIYDAIAKNELAIELNENKEFMSEEDINQLILKTKNSLINHNEIDSADDLKANPLVKREAKEKSKYKCQFDPSHITFVSKSDNNDYVEGHHLIPFSKRKDFDVNIDIVDNIVCLCPNCHRKIHLSVDEERNAIIEKLFNTRKDSLLEQGIFLELEELKSLY